MGVYRGFHALPPRLQCHLNHKEHKEHKEIQENHPRLSVAALAFPVLHSLDQIAGGIFQKGQCTLPGQAGCCRVVGLGDVRLKEPVPCVRVAMEGHRTAHAAQGFLQDFDVRLWIVLIVCGSNGFVISEEVHESRSIHPIRFT